MKIYSDYRELTELFAVEIKDPRHTSEILKLLQTHCPLSPKVAL
jgi:hypothetical protein